MTDINIIRNENNSFLTDVNKFSTIAAKVVCLPFSAPEFPNGNIVKKRT